MNPLSKLRCTDGAAALRALAAKFARDASGATALEYGLMASLMGMAVITAMAIFGDGLTKTYDSLSGLTARITLDQ